jgi:hypothetical protein
VLDCCLAIQTGSCSQQVQAVLTSVTAPIHKCGCPTLTSVTAPLTKCDSLTPTSVNNTLLY